MIAGVLGGLRGYLILYSWIYRPDSGVMVIPRRERRSYSTFKEYIQGIPSYQTKFTWRSRYNTSRDLILYT
jgi:hypothetical protein